MNISYDKVHRFDVALENLTSAIHVFILMMSQPINSRPSSLSSYRPLLVPLQFFAPLNIYSLCSRTAEGSCYRNPNGPLPRTSPHGSSEYTVRDKDPGGNGAENKQRLRSRFVFFFRMTIYTFLPSVTQYKADTQCNAVARIAYIASDIVLSVQPALGLPSEFSEYLHVFAANKASGFISRTTPEVHYVQQLCHGGFGLSFT